MLTHIFQLGLVQPPSRKRLGRDDNHWVTFEWMIFLFVKLGCEVVGMLIFLFLLQSCKCHLGQVVILTHIYDMSYTLLEIEFKAIGQCF